MTLHLNRILGCEIPASLMNGGFTKKGKGVHFNFNVELKKNLKGLPLSISILADIFRGIEHIYVIQHMPFVESFYPKCPMSPVSVHIFSMDSHCGMHATKWEALAPFFT